jgi:hypothetical protein
LPARVFDFCWRPNVSWKKNLKYVVTVWAATAILIGATACAHSSRFGVGSGSGAASFGAGSETGSDDGSGSGAGGASSGGSGASGGSSSSASSGASSGLGARTAAGTLYSSGNTLKSVGFDSAGNPIMQVASGLEESAVSTSTGAGPAGAGSATTATITVIDTSAAGFNGAGSAQLLDPGLTLAGAPTATAGVTNDGVNNVLSGGALGGSSLLNAQAAGENVVSGQNPVVDANVLPGGAPVTTSPTLTGSLGGTVTGSTAATAPSAGNVTASAAGTTASVAAPPLP